MLTESEINELKKRHNASAYDRGYAEGKAAGIGQERARAAKVCWREAKMWRDIAGSLACETCAKKIEAPAAGGQPKE